MFRSISISMKILKPPPMDPTHAYRIFPPWRLWLLPLLPQPMTLLAPIKSVHSTSTYSSLIKNNLTFETTSQETIISFQLQEQEHPASRISLYTNTQTCQTTRARTSAATGTVLLAIATSTSMPGQPVVPRAQPTVQHGRWRQRWWLIWMPGRYYSS